MRYGTLFHVLSLLFLSCAIGQDIAPNLSGVWRWNPEKGPRREHPPEELRVKVEQNGADISITFRSKNKGQEEINTARLRIGSSDNKNEIHGAPMLSSAAWEGAALVAHSGAKLWEDEVRMDD